MSDHHQGINDISKLGDVSEVMDKAIGRLVYRIKGSVSSQNYLAVRGYELPHHLLHIQLCRLGMNPVTFHLEIETSTGGFLRISLSTLYEKEPPRFLGRSLRYYFETSLFAATSTDFSYLNLNLY
jgi:hypothetical protein